MIYRSYILSKMVKILSKMVGFFWPTLYTTQYSALLFEVFLAQISELILQPVMSCVTVCVCLCVNHGGTDHNCYTYKLISLHGVRIFTEFL